MEDRQKIWDEYTGPKNGPMRRMFLDYNRYFEAGAIEDALESMHVDFTKLRVMDYGCGVADYGIYFGRLGSVVCLYDIDKEAVAFAEHRFKIEGLTMPIIDILEENHDLVIFGEVLDHLEDPLEVIKSFAEDARFIFTSSYPYRSDDPNDVHWQHDHHPKTALAQQPEVRAFLLEHYNKLNFGGQRNLWTRKISR